MLNVWTVCDAVTFYMYPVKQEKRASQGGKANGGKILTCELLHSATLHRIDSTGPFPKIY